MLARKWWPPFTAEEVEEAEVKWPAQSNPNSTARLWQSQRAPAEKLPKSHPICPEVSFLSPHREGALSWAQEHINDEIDFPNAL